MSSLASVALAVLTYNGPFTWVALAFLVVFAVVYFIVRRRSR